MRLAAIQGLIAAVQEGSLRGAARRAGLSQPALSKMLRELELELGAPLLLRTTRGVVPTAQGQVLYEHSVRAEREFVAAQDQIRQLSGRMAGELHIGAVPLAVMLLMPETLRTFSQLFPDVILRVSEELYVAQLSRLRRSEVHVTIGGIPDDLSAGEFTVERLMRTTMVPTARHGSPWLSARRMSELQEARWVYTGAGPDAGYARQWFEREGLEAPRVGAVVNSTLSLLSLVATGECVALMPRQIAEHPMARAAVSIIPVQECGLDLEIGAILRPEDTATPLVRHLVAHLHRAANQVA